MSLPRSYDKAHFIVFSNDVKRFRKNAESYCEQALAAGFDSATSYTQEALRETQFWADNAAILEQPRGAGYWLWKPHILLEKLREVGPNDIVVYNDVGRYKYDAFPMFPGFPHAALELCARLPKRFIHGFLTSWFAHGHYTKGDCLTLMDADHEAIWRAPLVSACPLIYMPSEESILFLERWLKFARDPRILTDMEDQVGTAHPYFIDHRHDQAIGSILVHQTRAHHIDLSKGGGVFSSAREIWKENPKVLRAHTHIGYFSTIIENALPEGFLEDANSELDALESIVRNLTPNEEVFQFNLTRPAKLDHKIVEKMISEGDVRPTVAQIKTMFAKRFPVTSGHFHQLRKIKNIDWFWTWIENDLRDRCKDMPTDARRSHVSERAIDSIRAAYDEHPEIRERALNNLVWSYMTSDLRELAKEARRQIALPNTRDIISQYLDEEGRELLTDEAQMKAHDSGPLREKVGVAMRKRIMAYTQATPETGVDQAEAASPAIAAASPSPADSDSAGSPEG